MPGEKTWAVRQGMESREEEGGGDEARLEVYDARRKRRCCLLLFKEDCCSFEGLSVRLKPRLTVWLVADTQKAVDFSLTDWAMHTILFVYQCH